MYKATMIYHTVRRILLFGCLTAVLLALPADGNAAKWESIPQELLALKTNPYDPGAGALIVFNNAELRLFYKDQIWLEMDVYRRVKVFNEEGKEHATITIPYYNGDRLQNIKARVILPNGQKIDMPATAIVDVDRLSSLGRYASSASKLKRFTIPGVEDGAIIEYQYTRKTEYIRYLTAWSFQGADYTLSSTLKATVPKEIQYMGAFSNLTQEPKSTVEKWVDGRGTTYTWTVENVPGYAEEAYGLPWYSYVASMNFVLTQIYSTRSRVTYHILDSWDRVAEYGDTYRDYMGKRGRIPAVVQEITAGITDPMQKTAVIYDYVQRNMNYVDFWGVIPNSNHSGSILAGKQADNVDMNILLCAMLDEAGIKGSFAMLAPVDGRAFNSGIPTPTQFERLITQVTLEDGQTLWLDPVFKGAPLGVLPWQDQKVSAFLLEGDGKFLTTPKTAHLNKETHTITLNLDSEGNITGEGTISANGENAIGYRRQFAYSAPEKQREDFLEALQGQVSDADLTEFTYEDQLDVNNPVEVSFGFTAPDYATVAGNRLLVNPALIERMDQDILPATERKTPVFLGAVDNTNIEVTIKIPEGYEVEQKPSVVVLKSPFGRFVVTYTERSDTIVYKRLMMINKPNNSAQYYEDLRAFFDRISEADQQQIVLIASDGTESE